MKKAWLPWLFVPVPALLILASLPFWPPVDPVRPAHPGGKKAEPRSYLRLEPRGLAGESDETAAQDDSDQDSARSRRSGSGSRERRNEPTAPHAPEPQVHEPGATDSALLKVLGNANVSSGSAWNSAADQLTHRDGAPADELSARRAGGGDASLSIGSLGKSKSGGSDPTLGQRSSSGPEGRGDRGKRPGGRVAQDVARAVLDKAQGQAQYCYDTELERDPELRGSITFSFVVLPTGAVKEPSLERSTLSNERAEKCMMKVVARLRFPEGAAKEPAPITYSWRFGNAI